MKFHLSCQMPEPTDATSLYRGVGPLQTLRRQTNYDLELVVGGMVNWASLKGSDAVFLQRPALDNHVRMIDMAKANGKPVWVDYDDWLYGVPHFNKAARLYGKTNIQNNMSKLIAKADVVTVSTPFLKNQIVRIIEAIAKSPQQEKNLVLDPRKVVVVPNAYDLDIMSDLSEASKSPHQNKLVAWRGSGTHDKDLLNVTPNLASVIGRHLDWTYSFIGEPFWLSMEQLDQVPGAKETTVNIVETLDPIDYLAFMTTVKPAVMIVPLDDNPFNRSKSNIAWIEATHAGAVTIAPDFEEWRRPGILNYSTPEEFEKVLEDLLRGHVDGNFLWRQSRDFILENLTLPKVNQRRQDIINCLVERTPIGPIAEKWV